MALNYYISLSGLTTSQQFLNVTQMNIANMNTPGYAKQRLEVKANYPAGGDMIDAKIGAGVVATNLSRIRDEMLIQQSRNQQSHVGYFENATRFMSDVETIFNENGEGSVSKLFNSFFDEWEEVAKYPESLANRISLLGKAEKMVDRFNTIDKQFEVMEKELDKKISFEVDTINNTIEKIASMNKKIREVGPNVSNSMLDERDKYLDELSKKMNIEVSYDDQNPNIVTVKAGGAVVVNDAGANKINGFFDQMNQEWKLTASNVVLRPLSGSLKGELDARNQHIKAYEKDFNDMVNVFINKVNDIHRQGFGLDNTTGEDLFTGTNAGSIKLNDSILKNPEKLGISSIADTPGNSDMAKKLAELRDTKVMAGGNSSIVGFFNGYMIGIASNVYESQSNWEINQNVYMNVESERQRVQGVNMDEELANLMKYQHSYSANAKALQSVDRAFDTILQLIN